MAVPVLRFLIHDIRAVFLLFTLSIYLALCTIHCLFGYLIHKNGDSMRTKANIIFAPLHIAFLATIYKTGSCDLSLGQSEGWHQPNVIGKDDICSSAIVE